MHLRCSACSISNRWATVGCGGSGEREAGVGATQRMSCLPDRKQRRIRGTLEDAGAPPDCPPRKAFRNVFQGRGRCGDGSCRGASANELHTCVTGTAHAAEPDGLACRIRGMRVDLSSP